MIDDELSELPKSALRDYADDPRVDRVWQRLDAGLAAKPARARTSLWLAPAFGVALFAGGVLVGRHSAPVHDAAPSVAAEFPTPSEAPREAAPALPAAEQPRVARVADPRRPQSLRPHSVQPPGVIAEEEVLVTEAAPYAAPPAQVPEWQQKADAGDFAGARAALDRLGGWDVALAGASPDQLMTLVDLGRASGERGQAVRALRRLLDAFPGAPEAPLAAWTLANQLEQGGDHAGAAEAYALYRRLSPAGDFAEDAAARQVDAALAQGDADRATELIEQYAKDFPNGRRLAELREELEKLKGDAHKPSDEKSGAAPAAAPDAAAAPSEASELKP
ncbi:MAG: tetratricopeptide repeat protein [Myxococcota bacterium]